jgi:hypothetical protein
VIGQPSVYRPDWMRKPNWVLNDCRETDADEEQDDDRSRARLQRPLVSMMRVYAALGRLPTWLLKPGVYAQNHLVINVIGMLRQRINNNRIASPPTLDIAKEQDYYAPCAIGIPKSATK